MTRGERDELITLIDAACTAVSALREHPAITQAPLTEEAARQAYNTLDDAAAGLPEELSSD